MASIFSDFVAFAFGKGAEIEACKILHFGLQFAGSGGRVRACLIDADSAKVCTVCRGGSRYVEGVMVLWLYGFIFQKFTKLPFHVF